MVLNRLSLRNIFTFISFLIFLALTITNCGSGGSAGKTTDSTSPANHPIANSGAGCDSSSCLAQVDLMQVYSLPTTSSLLKLVPGKPLVVRAFFLNTGTNKDATMVPYTGITPSATLYVNGVSQAMNCPSTLPILRSGDFPVRSSELSRHCYANVDSSLVKNGLAIRVVTPWGEIDSTPSVTDPSLLRLLAVQTVYQGRTSTLPSVQDMKNAMVGKTPNGNNAIIDIYPTAFTFASSLNLQTNQPAMIGAISDLCAQNYPKYNDCIGFINTPAAGVVGSSIVGVDTDLWGRGIAIDTNYTGWRRTFTHEVGHTLSLYHSPCSAGSTDPVYAISGIDSSYWTGFSQAKLSSSPIYDLINSNFANTATQNTDIMAYCDGQWFSEFTYNKAADFIASLAAFKPDAVATASYADSTTIVDTSNARTIFIKETPRTNYGSATSVDINVVIPSQLTGRSLTLNNRNVPCNCERHTDTGAIPYSYDPSTGILTILCYKFLGQSSSSRYYYISVTVNAKTGAVDFSTYYGNDQLPQSTARETLSNDELGGALSIASTTGIIKISGILQAGQITLEPAQSYNSYPITQDSGDYELKITTEKGVIAKHFNVSEVADVNEENPPYVFFVTLPKPDSIQKIEVWRDGKLIPTLKPTTTTSPAPKATERSSTSSLPPLASTDLVSYTETKSNLVVGWDSASYPWLSVVFVDSKGERHLLTSRNEGGTISLPLMGVTDGGYFEFGLSDGLNTKTITEQRK